MFRGRNGAALEVFFGYDGEAAREVFSFCCPVTNNDDVVECAGEGLKGVPGWTLFGNRYRVRYREAVVLGCRVQMGQAQEQAQEYMRGSLFHITRMWPQRNPTPGRRTIYTNRISKISAVYGSVGVGVP